MNSSNSLKTKISRKDLTVGTWITLGHPSIAEIMAQAGFDWLAIDMEHSAITLHQAQQLIQTADLSGCPPLVRVGHNDGNLIKRVMDAGAHGIIVPMVNSREDAQRAVAAVQYPPGGTRGVGLGRAQKYGTDFPGYARWNAEQSVVVVQIEHIEAVNNLEAILSVAGVDAFIVGPYDLSGSLGHPGEFDHPLVVEALERVRRVSAELDAVAGFHVVQPDLSQVREKLSAGYRFLGFSLDSLLLADACRRGLDDIAKFSGT